MAVTLPEDILLLVMDILDHQRDQDILLSCCMLNRRCARRAQRAIYKDPRPLNQAQHLQLLLSLARSSRLRSLVERLTPLSPKLYARWLVPAVVRLVARVLRTLPSLHSITYSPGRTLGHAPLLGLPDTLQELALSENIDTAAMRALNEHPSLKRLSIPSFGIFTEALLEEWITPATCPHLKTLTGSDVAVFALLPGRRIDTLTLLTPFGQGLWIERELTNGLSQAFRNAASPLRSLHLSTENVYCLFGHLGTLLSLTPELENLRLDFSELGSLRVVVDFLQSKVLDVIGPVPHLRTLWLALHSPDWLQRQRSELELHCLWSVCPELEEVTLSDLSGRVIMTYPEGDRPRFEEEGTSTFRKYGRAGGRGRKAGEVGAAGSRAMGEEQGGRQ